MIKDLYLIPGSDGHTLGRALTETSKNANSASNKVEGDLAYISNDYSLTIA